MGLIAGGDGGSDGTLIVDESRLSVTAQVAGNGVLGRRPRSYEVRDAAEMIATVDVCGRIVWLARRAPADHRPLAAAGAAVALLRYQRPVD
jgi:hypothetical protein